MYTTVRLFQTNALNTEKQHRYLMNYNDSMSLDHKASVYSLFTSLELQSSLFANQKQVNYPLVD